jgi:antitoxin ParD1/3/4
MSKNTSVSLGDHFQAFIASQISDGRYDSASEVIRAGLRLLENHEARMAALRAELAKGVASDFIDGFDFDDFIRGRLKGQDVSG